MPRRGALNRRVMREVCRHRRTIAVVMSVHHTRFGLAVWWLSLPAEQSKRRCHQWLGMESRDRHPVECMKSELCLAMQQLEMPLTDRFGSFEGIAMALRCQARFVTRQQAFWCGRLDARLLAWATEIAYRVSFIPRAWQLYRPVTAI